MKQITAKFDKCCECPHWNNFCSAVADDIQFLRQGLYKTKIHPDCPLDDVVDKSEIQNIKAYSGCRKDIKI